MVKTFLLALVLFASLAVSMLPVGPVMAQSTEEFLSEEACEYDPANGRYGPNSELCICAKVRQFGLYPEYTTNAMGEVVVRDVDNDTYFPSLNSEGFWEDHPMEADNASATPPGTVSDLSYLPNRRYGQNCSLSYFRENLRRLWFFAVALGGALAALSLAWAGVAYMQASASGADLSKSRVMIMRVLVGPGYPRLCLSHLGGGEQHLPGPS